MATNQIDVKVKYLPDTSDLKSAMSGLQEMNLKVGNQNIKKDLVTPIQSAMRELDKSLESGADTSQIIKGFEKVNKAIEDTRAKTISMQKDIDNVFNSSSNQKMLKDLENYKKELNKIESEITKWDKKFSNSVLTNLKLEADVSGIAEARKLLEEQQKQLDISKEMTEEEEKRYIAAQKYVDTFNERQSSTSKSELERQRSDVSSRIRGIESSVMTEDVHLEATKANNEILSATSMASQNAKRGLDDFTASAKQQEQQLKENQKQLSKFGDILTGTFLGTSISNLMQTGLQQGIQFFKEYDETLTRTMMVTGMTRDEVNSLTSSYNELANQLSSTTKDVAAAQLVFYQQGLGTQDALEMTEASIAVSKTGGIEAAEAADRLTSAIKGYQLAAEDAMDVVDKMSALDAAAASSVDELTVAMQKSASQARMAGLDMDYYMAYLSTMQEVTREAPENIGTAMKSITSRMQEISDIGKVEEDGTTFNNVAEALSSIGIAATDSAGQLRPLQEVFDELGPQWDRLDRNHQAYIATVLAGNRQQSRFIALMDNYDRAMELVTVSQNSAGESAKQLRAYDQGLESSFVDLTNAWQQFATTIADSSLIKTAVDMLTNLIEIVNSLPDGLVQAVTYFRLFNTGLNTFQMVTQNLSNSGFDLSKMFGMSDFQKNLINSNTLFRRMASTVNQVGNSVKGLFTTGSNQAGEMGNALKVVNTQTEAVNASTFKSIANQQALNSAKTVGLGATAQETYSIDKLGAATIIAGQAANVLGNEVKEYTEAMNTNDGIVNKETIDNASFAQGTGIQTFTDEITASQSKIGQYKKSLETLTSDLNENIEREAERILESGNYNQVAGTIKSQRTKMAKSQEGPIRQMSLETPAMTRENEIAYARTKIPELNSIITELENTASREKQLLNANISAEEQIIKVNKQNIKAINDSTAAHVKNTQTLNSNVSNDGINLEPKQIQQTGNRTGGLDFSFANMSTKKPAGLEGIGNLQVNPNLGGVPKQLNSLTTSAAKATGVVSNLTGTLGKFKGSINMTNVGMGLMASTFVGMATDALGMNEALGNGVQVTAALLPTLGKMGPYGIAAAVGIGAATAAFQHFFPSIEAVEKQLTELGTERDGLEQTQVTIESSLDTYIELSNKLNKTEEEQSALNSAIASLQEEVPGAVAGYNNMGEAIIDVSKATEELNDIQSKLAINSNSTLKEFDKLQSAQVSGWEKVGNAIGHIAAIGLVVPTGGLSLLAEFPLLMHNDNMADRIIEGNKTVWAENFEEIFGAMQGVAASTVAKGSDSSEQLRQQISDSILNAFALDGMTNGLEVNDVQEEVAELYDKFGYGDLDIISNIVERTQVTGEITSASWEELKEQLTNSITSNLAGLNLDDEEFETILNATLSMTYTGQVNINNLQESIDEAIEKEMISSASGKHMQIIMEDLDPTVVNFLDSMGLLNGEMADMFLEYDNAEALEQIFTDVNGELDKEIGSLQILNGLLAQKNQLESDVDIDALKEERANIEKEIEELKKQGVGSPTGMLDYNNKQVGPRSFTGENSMGSLEETLADLDEEILMAENGLGTLESAIDGITSAFESIQAPTFGEMATEIDAIKETFQDIDSLAEEIADLGGNMDLSSISNMFNILDGFEQMDFSSSPEAFERWGAALDQINNSLVIENGQLVAQEGLMTGLNDLSAISAQLKMEELKASIQAERLEIEMQNQILQTQIAAIDAAIASLQAQKTAGEEEANIAKTKAEVDQALNDLDSALNKEIVLSEAAKNNEVLRLSSEAAAQYSAMWAAAKSEEGYDGGYDALSANLDNLIAATKSTASDEIMSLINEDDISGSISALESMKEGLQGQISSNNALLDSLAVKEKLADYLASDTTNLDGLAQSADDASDSQSDYNEKLERTLTLLERIAGLQHTMDENDAFKSVYEGYDGEAYGRILMTNLDLAKQQYEVQKDLFEMQQQITNQAAGDLLDSQYGSMFSIQENGDIGWANLEMYDKYKNLPDDMQEDIDGLVEAFQSERDELRDVEKELIGYAEATKEAREEIVAMEIEVENELVNALKNREKILHDARIKALDDEITMIEEAVEARQESRENDESEQELYEAQEALRRATLDSSGKNNASLLQLQQDLEDKQLEISEKRFEDDMEDRTQWLQDTKDAETETYEYRLETMTWYWENVQAIQEAGQAAMIQTLIMWNEEYRVQSNLQQQEMLREWTFTMDAMKSASDMGAELDKLTSDIVSTTQSVESMNISVQALPGSWYAAASAANTYASAANAAASAYNNYSAAVEETNNKIAEGYYCPMPDSSSNVAGFAMGVAQDVVSSMSNISGSSSSSSYTQSTPFTYYSPTTKKFASGGIVDYTGPAWVDGTKTKPEAFLSAYQTEQIGSLAKSISGNEIDNSVGSSTIEFGSISFNVASMSNADDGKKALDAFVKGANDLMSKKGVSTRLSMNTK